ncbi:MAG: hypothetical protein V2J02_11465 [Pseudomonadales bacterium]|jgi:hypothetical protein|nr:hypothetical protein [Pseudomonadales bacterium]
MDEQLRRDVPELDALDAERARGVVVKARGRAAGSALLGALAVAAMVVGVSVPLLVTFGPGFPGSILLQGLAAGAGAFLAVRTHRALLRRGLIREVRRELAGRG